MAFVFQQPRKNMTQHQLCTLQKILLKQLYHPHTRNINTQIYKRKYPFGQKLNLLQTQQHNHNSNKTAFSTFLSHPQIRKYHQHKQVRHSKQQSNTLGPGQYDLPLLTHSKTLVKYKLQLKNNDGCQQCQKNVSPGPADYSPNYHYKIKGNVGYHAQQSLTKNNSTPCIPIEEKCFKPCYKFMRSPQFKLNINTPKHLNYLLKKIIRRKE